MDNNHDQVENASERATVRPRVDVFENQDEYLVIADMPGVTSDHLHINLHRGRLTIEGNVAGGPSGNPIEREWGATAYRRSFDVPDTIDNEKVSADLKHGVLWLHLPKHESVKPRQIQVRAG
ncbi:MAG TPA: Hsp20/alpha crystallin family protein [Kofleriaceae bacterium]|jgi:HSP20 family molecular chaperone IbpA|nr:Hsp20/alpha crystallin family protein [Kofleriaceae bacterium]